MHPQTLISESSGSDKMAVWYMGRVLAQTPARFSATPGVGRSDKGRSGSNFCKSTRLLIGLDTAPSTGFMLWSSLGETHFRKHYNKVSEIHINTTENTTFLKIQTQQTLIFVAFIFAPTAGRECTAGIVRHWRTWQIVGMCKAWFLDLWGTWVIAYPFLHKMRV
jgi:hypothetical protein